MKEEIKSLNFTEDKELEEQHSDNSTENISEDIVSDSNENPK